jgi:hypothetical protein
VSEDLRRAVWNVLAQVELGCRAEPALAEPLAELRAVFLCTPGWVPGVSDLDDPDAFPRRRP